MSAKYSPQQALDLIRKILDEGGYPVPSKQHAKRERMVERNVDMQDIEILLSETGVIRREAEWDEKHKNYKYRVEGTDGIGEDLTAIVVIEENYGRIRIVTVF